MIKQLERSARFLKLSEKKINYYIRKGINKLETLSLELPPSLFTTEILNVMYEEECRDPFKKAKREQNKKVQKIVPLIKEEINKSKNPLYTAFFYSSLGNIIDLGPQDRYDFESLIYKKKKFDKDDFNVFSAKLKKGGKLLYILDNAGEAVIDLLVVNILEEYFKDYRIVAREKPILNDITVEEAVRIGFKKEKLISTGKRVLGVDFKNAPEELLEWYKNADVVIGKGHANFESLVDGERDAFCILQVKCPVVGRYLNTPVGSSVFYYYQP